MLVIVSSVSELVSFLCLRKKKRYDNFALCFETPVTSPPIRLEDSDGTNNHWCSRVLSGRLGRCPLGYILLLRGQRSGITAESQLNLRSKRKVKSFSTFLFVFVLSYLETSSLVCVFCVLTSVWFCVPLTLLFHFLWSLDKSSVSYNSVEPEGGFPVLDGSSHVSYGAQILTECSKRFSDKSKYNWIHQEMPSRTWTWWCRGHICVRKTRNGK